MGRWWYGLLISAALVAGCAAAATPEEVSAQTGSDSDMGGGPVIDNCTDGDSCDTGNPGDCSMGHAVCNGKSGKGTCVPDGTTQGCYDGPANTMGVGVCKAGIQTCVGALGSCDGQVKPAAQEDCFNDLDDDCDGVVNNGCPDHLTTGMPRPLTAVGNSGSGTAFSLRCPTGSFISKTQIWGDNGASVLALTALDVYCATPTLVRGASSYSATVKVSTTALSAGTDRPSSPTTTFTCDAASFSPGWLTPGTGANGAGGGIDGLGLSCASTSLALDATNKLSFNMTQVAATSSTGNNPDGYRNASPFDASEANCNQGEVLIGYDGKVASYITYFQAICAPLQVVYK